MDAQDQAGGRETVEGGVVLRFPGDWVGSLDELVPFGPSADRDSSAEGADFWGEDSAVLQDAVEAPEPQRPPMAPRQPIRVRPWLVSAGAVFAAALFALAAVLDRSPSSAPHVQGVPFSIASIPPLAPASAAVRKHSARHRATTRPQRHPKPAQRAVVSSRTTASSSPVTTPSPTYHPAPSSAASQTSADSGGSQGGGAFTLGGP